MPEILLGQSTETFSGIALTQYVNDQNETHFNNIVGAILGLGVTVVATSLCPPLARIIATGLGVELALNLVIDVVEKALDDNDLESTLKRMKEGDSLKVTTKFYEWSSSSGQSYTYYSTESYQIV